MGIRPIGWFKGSFYLFLHTYILESAISFPVITRKRSRHESDVTVQR